MSVKARICVGPDDKVLVSQMTFAAAPDFGDTIVIGPPHLPEEKRYTVLSRAWVQGPNPWTHSPDVILRVTLEASQETPTT